MPQTPGVIKVELLLSVVVFALWIYTLAEVLTTPEGAVRNVPKVAWLVIVLLLPVLGTIGWFVLGRPEGRYRRPAGAYERQAPEFPEYDRPGRAAAVDQERDEAFLRQVRSRAEEQRKRHDADRKRRQQQEGTEPS